MSMGPKPMLLKPGRRIIKVPKNPINIALHRRIPTFSPKKNIAKMVAKMGAVKLKAVSSAKGVSVTPVKKASIETPLIKPRIA